MRRFLGQFAIPARITDDAGVKRRVFNPWGPLADMEADARPIADVVVTDIVSSPGNRSSLAFSWIFLMNFLPQAWRGLSRAGALPPMPEYFLLAAMPVMVFLGWWILATDKRNQVAPRLFLYGRCACCCYQLRETAPAAQGEVHCPECGACWKVSRFGQLKDLPQAIGDVALEYSRKGVLDADWNYRPMPNLRGLRRDSSMTFARDAWEAGTDARFFTMAFYGVLAIGLVVLTSIGLPSPVTALSYLYSVAMLGFAIWFMWLMYATVMGIGGAGIKTQANKLLKANRCPCCLSEIPAGVGEEPRQCVMCGSRWKAEVANS